MFKKKSVSQVMAALAGVILFYSGCSGIGGSSSSSSDTVKRAYGPVSETTTYTYQTTKHDGSIANDVSLKKTGTKMINNVTYNEYQAGIFSGTTKNGIHVWMNGNPDSNNLVVAGGEGYYPYASNPTQPYATVTLDPPVTLNMNTPVGAVQPIHTTASISLSGSTLPVTLQGYTLVGDNETVTTGMGMITGCKHFTGSAVISGVQFSVDAWYRQGVGLVAGKVNWPPPNGVSINLLSTQDLGSAQAGFNTIESMTVISPSNPNFKLDTYDVNNQFDADKYTDAQMLLEMRWVDDALAKQANPTSPFLSGSSNIEFGDVYGYFPFDLIASPVSILHPEENGKGYTYWIGYVSEADKYQSGPNGIAYHIYVKLPDYVSHALRVSARIHYHLVTP